MPKPTTDQARISNPRMVLICYSCQDAWEIGPIEPSELPSNQTGCPRCGGWTWLAEITEPDTAATGTPMTTKRAS